jgi:cell division protein DivIC
VFFRRFIVVLYLLLFVCVAAASTTFFLQTRAEYLQLREVERVTTERLALAETRLKEQEEMLRRLREDPSYVEMVRGRMNASFALSPEQMARSR